jgi:hypothetical protein
MAHGYLSVLRSVYVLNFNGYTVHIIGRYTKGVCQTNVLRYSNRYKLQSTFLKMVISDVAGSVEILFILFIHIAY